VASVDSSKYGLVYQNRILNLEDIDTLVIDKLEQKQQEIFKGKSIDVRIAN